jgi:hypothetical protein
MSNSGGLEPMLLLNSVIICHQMRPLPARPAGEEGWSATQITSSTSTPAGLPGR